MLSKSFKAGKCKTSLKLAVARIKLLKNKREAQVKQMRRELAQLLAAGQDQSARIRVEHVIREEKTMSAYALIEIYCELIVTRLAIIEAQKSCPIDLKEAITSVVFASPRCADIPELTDVKKHFVAKYGKEFITSALEVRPDCGVNRMMIEKLSAKAPDVEIKTKILTAIAQEHNVEWDPKAFEEELQKPNADLLNGPNTFANASKMTMDSSDSKLSSTPYQRNESKMNMFHNDITKNPTSMNTVSYTKFSASASSTSQNESRATEISSGEEAIPYSRKGGISFDRQSWNMEFKDATSAAQAAAESAERASVAARAAAELARRGNVSRQSSIGSRQSSMHGIRNNIPDKSKDPKMGDGESAHEFITDEEMLKRFQDLKQEEHNLQINEDIQGGSRRVTENMDDRYASFRRRPLGKSLSRESSISVGLSEANKHEAGNSAYDHVERSFSAPKPEEQEIKNNENENIGSFGNSEYHQFKRGTIDDTSDRDTNFQKHATCNIGDYRRIYSGRETQGSDRKQSASGNYSSAVFDDYGSDTDGISLSGRYGDRNSSDLFVSSEEEPSAFHLKGDSFSPKQHPSGSLFRDGSSQLHFATETPSTKHSKNLISPLVSDKTLPVAFDDSDGVGTESEEDEMAESVHREPRTADGIWKKTGSSRFPDNRPSSKSDKTSTNLTNSETVSYKFQSSEDSLGMQSSKFSAAEKAETSDRVGTQSPPSVTRETAFQYGSESGQGLSFGRLTGGFKNKGFQQPPYVKSPSANTSFTSQQISNDTNMPIVSNLNKSSAGFEFRDNTKNDKDAQQGEPNSRNSGPSYKNYNFDKANSAVNLSRRTKDSPIDAKRGNHSRFISHSNMPDDSEKGSKTSRAIYSSSESFSSSMNPAGSLKGAESAKSLKPNSSGKEPSVAPTTSLSSSINADRQKPSGKDSNQSAQNVNPTTSSPVGGLTSRESSLNKPSHVHPKLPDYDTFAAHFKSLRSNRQDK